MHWLRYALAIAAICFVPLAAPAQGQTAAAGGAAGTASATPADTAALKQLLATLQDPAQRDRFIADLKTLIATREQPAAPAEPGLGARALDALSTGFAWLSTGFDSVASGLSDPGSTWHWVTRQVTDPVQRQAALEILGYIALILAGGAVAHLIASLLIRRSRSRLAARPAPGGSRRLALAVAGFGLSLLPIIAFAATSLALVVWVMPPHELRLIVLAIVNAATLTMLGTATTRLLLSPAAPPLRLLPLADETAAYLLIWARRLIIVLVWSYLLLQTALLLRLDPAGYFALSELLGLLVLGLVLILIWQNRQPVAAWIRGETVTTSQIAKGAELPGSITDTETLPPPEAAAQEEPVQAAEREAVAGRVPEGELAEPGPAAPETADTTTDETAAPPPPIAGWRVQLGSVWHILATVYALAVYTVWALAIPRGLSYVAIATIETSAIVGVLIVAEIELRRLLGRLFAVDTGILARYPLVALHAGRYVPALRSVLVYLLRAIAALAVLAAWRISVVHLLATPVVVVALSHLAGIAIIVVVALVVWEVAAASISAYLNRSDQNGQAVVLSARARTLLPLVRNILFITISVMVVLAVLAELGVNIAPLLAGAGVAGLAIGIGAQSLVKDVITGAFILFEGTLNIGDVVQINGQGGVVEGLTVRTIRLRDISGNVLTVPFGSVTSVTNMTKEFSYYLLDVGVAYREDTDEVVAIMREVDDELRQDADFTDKILEPLEVLGVDRFADSAVYVRARTKTRPIQQWKVGREFNRRLKHKFDERGIEMPFPHRTVYFGELKNGTAPPAHLDLRREPTRRASRRTRSGERKEQPGAEAAES